jgi:hypothetical protein
MFKTFYITFPENIIKGALITKYNYLLHQPEYINVSKYIYIGDLKEYF